MHTTSSTLLQRLRQPGDESAWQRFAQLYTPLLYYWARRLGCQPEDASDLVQEVFTFLIRKLPEFQYHRDQSFRSWLHTVTLNRWRDLCKRRVEKPLPPDDSAFQDVPAADPLEEGAQREYHQVLLQQAMRIMQSDFEPATWKACWMYVVEGKPAQEVAAELGLRVGNVYVAKSRVLSRLRQELEELLD